jgi:hypothetical protein
MRHASLLLAFACFVGSLSAQAPPRITLVQPAGGKAGSTFEVSVVGNDFDGVEGLHFDFQGATTEILKAEKIDDGKKDGGGKKNRGMQNLGPVTGQRFKVTLPANAPLGIHDVRIVTKNGISNPRAFVVGDLPETMEMEPNNDVPQAQSLAIDSTVNGVISAPVDVDYYRFPGKKGQRVVASCLTSSIDSRLHATIEIYSRGDRLLAINRNYANNDAVADAILPEDGDYTVRVFDFTYEHGGPEYFYRLTVSTAPWIDAIFPQTLEPGKETKVTILGRNLPGGVLDPAERIDGHPLEKLVTTIKAPAAPMAAAQFLPPAASNLPGFEFRLKNPVGSSNPYWLTMARGPVTVEAEPNDRFDAAMKVTVPCEIAGRLDRRADVDWYRFAAKKGQPLFIEVIGDRLGNTFSPRFAVANAKGVIVASSPETPEVSSTQFFVRHEDPSPLRFAAAEEADYLVMVSAADNSAGPRNGYTLRIAPERGDFAAVAMPLSTYAPDSGNVGAAGHYAYTVFVHRSGNFQGDVTIAPKTLPPGATMAPQVVAGSQKQGAIVISVDEKAAPYAGPIVLEATATIDGKKETRPVQAATITYPLAQQQNNVPTYSRMDRELVLAIRGKAAYAVIPASNKIEIHQGEKISIAATMKALSPDFKAPVTVSVSGPLGLTLTPTALPADKETTLTFDIKGNGADKIVPGTYTIVLRGETQPVDPKKNNGNKKPGAGPPNIIEHSVPIELVILPKQGAKKGAMLAPPRSGLGFGLGAMPTALRGHASDLHFVRSPDPDGTTYGLAKE